MTVDAWFFAATPKNIDPAKPTNAKQAAMTLEEIGEHSFAQRKQSVEWRGRLPIFASRLKLTFQMCGKYLDKTTNQDPTMDYETNV